MEHTEAALPEDHHLPYHWSLSGSSTIAASHPMHLAWTRKKYLRKTTKMTLVYQIREVLNVSCIITKLAQKIYYISHIDHNSSDKSIMLKNFYHIAIDLVLFLEKIYSAKVKVNCRNNKNYF